MGKIKSITEAFSMQPTTIMVVSQDSKFKRVDSCKEIVIETHRVDSEKECDFYVGYNFEGKKLFEYLRSSVNVHYDNN